MASIPEIPQSQTHELLSFDQQECRSLLHSASKPVEGLKLEIDIASMSSPEKLPKRFHLRDLREMQALLEV